MQQKTDSAAFLKSGITWVMEVLNREAVTKRIDPAGSEMNRVA